MAIATGQQILAADVNNLIPGDTIVSSEYLRNSNDTERTTTSTTYVKKKEILLNADLPNCRIKFGIKNSSPTHWTYGRIYKNGVAIGTEQSQQGSSYETFSEDFSGFVSGDLIQIYIKVDSGYTGYVANMRLCYDKAIGHICLETLRTPLPITSDPTISVTNQDP